MKYYRVYGKHKTKMKSFRAMDMNNLEFVGNLMYASFFKEDELEDLQTYVKELNKLNPDYVFEVRKVN